MYAYTVGVPLLDNSLTGPSVPLCFSLERLRLLEIVAGRHGQTGLVQVCRSLLENHLRHCALLISDI